MRAKLRPTHCEDLGLAPEVAMRLLADADFGRIVFTQHGIPMIRPLHHLVDEDTIVTCARPTCKLASCVQAGGSHGVMVAYEAEDLHPRLGSGWYVVVTGPAYPVTDPTRIACYEPQLLPIPADDTCLFIEIEPTTVIGVRFVPTAGSG